MSLFEELKELGVDIDGGLKRIGGNEKLYTRLLGKFIDAVNTYNVQADFDAADCKEVIEKTHALKGTSGNLSLTPIYEAYTKIVDLLRADKVEEARAILVDVLPIQEKIVNCIQSHMEQ